MTLFKFLSTYDHDYVVYYDFFHWPYGDKTFDQSLACVEKWINYLTQQNVDYIILPPIYELYCLIENGKLKIEHSRVLPLFKTYLLDECFKHSLVGKFGLLGDFADVEQAQPLIKKVEKTYTLASNQKAIKKFHSPFVYRTKETPLWKYYLTSLSYSNILVNKIIKFDLRYFKDAMVDTLIPLNYGYFHYQTTITKYLNLKKIRFHTLKKVEDIFVSFKLKEAQTYTVKIVYTGNCDFLTREKRLMWLLQKGKSTEIIFEKL